jgi:hypothetical protein
VVPNLFHRPEIGLHGGLREVVSQAIDDEPFMQHPSADPLKKRRVCGFHFSIPFILRQLQTTHPQTLGMRQGRQLLSCIIGGFGDGEK